MTTEAMLIEILEEVIGVTDLDRHARFLDIGGNSLNLIEVLKQIKDRTGVAIGPRIFFEKARSSVASISAAIDAERQSAAAALSAAD